VLDQIQHNWIAKIMRQHDVLFAMSVIDIAKRVIKYYAQSNRRLETLSY
jgi:hypothetical protein